MGDGGIRRIKTKGTGSAKHWLPAAVQRACWGRWVEAPVRRRRVRGKQPQRANPSPLVVPGHGP
eukprot:989497-Pyramimonas_sp.AAC.1